MRFRVDHWRCETTVVVRTLVGLSGIKRVSRVNYISCVYYVSLSVLCNNISGAFCEAHIWWRFQETTQRRVAVLFWIRWQSAPWLWNLACCSWKQNEPPAKLLVCVVTLHCLSLQGLNKGELELKFWIGRGSFQACVCKSEQHNLMCSRCQALAHWILRNQPSMRVSIMAASDPLYFVVCHSKGFFCDPSIHFVFFDRERLIASTYRVLEC